MRHAALLRGINVGGNNKLAMPALVSVFTEAGCTDVSTYIQSGNVVFSAGTKLARSIAAEAARAITRRFGLTVPVVVRSAAELAATIAGNPLRSADPAALHVMFLADRPSAAAIASLDPRRSATDDFVVVGKQVYLRCPNGIGNSKLTNSYFDTKLATVSTCRNWRTVERLVALSA